MSLLRKNRELLDRFRAGETKAIETVYREYIRKVERLLTAGFEVRGRATRVRGVSLRADDLADLVQEVFVRAFSERTRLAYDGLRDYGPFLYAIARNVLVDWSRIRHREVPSPWAELEDALAMIPIAEDEAPWASQAVVQVVDAYIRSLPQDLRAIHQLRHEECFSQEQAAETLGIGRQTVRTLEHRLRNGLARALAEAGI